MAGWAQMIKRLLALLALLPFAAHADFVRDVEWSGGGDQALDLTNAGDPVVIVAGFDEGTDHADVTQGTAAIDTTAPESMTAGPVETEATSKYEHGETFYRTTAKTGSTTIDISHDNNFRMYAMLLEGFDATLSDSCTFYTSWATGHECSVTVPANGIVVVFAQTENASTVSSWTRSATEREYITGTQNGETIIARAATKVETSGVTANFGVTYTTNESGGVLVLVFAEAASGSTTTCTDPTVDPDGSEQMNCSLDVPLSSNITRLNCNSGTLITDVESADTDSALVNINPNELWVSGGADFTLGQAVDCALENASETSTADSITFNLPQAGDAWAVELACDEDGTPTACDTDSLLLHANWPGLGLDTGDELFLDNCSLAGLSDNAVIAGTPPLTCDLYAWTSGSWVAANTMVIPANCTDGVVQSQVISQVESQVGTQQCSSGS